MSGITCTRGLTLSFGYVANGLLLIGDDARSCMFALGWAPGILYFSSLLALCYQVRVVSVPLGERSSDLIRSAQMAPFSFLNIFLGGITFSCSSDSVVTKLLVLHVPLFP